MNFGLPPPLHAPSSSTPCMSATSSKFCPTRPGTVLRTPCSQSSNAKGISKGHCIATASVTSVELNPVKYLIRLECSLCYRASVQRDASIMQTSWFTLMLDQCQQQRHYALHSDCMNDVCTQYSTAQHAYLQVDEGDIHSVVCNSRKGPQQLMPQ
jgi:CRISPR/Cas system-associated exonuclease Cas4 (RecB family)